jgi:hypothetical protein
MKIADHIFLQSVAVAFLFVGFGVLAAFGIQQVIAFPWGLMVSIPVTITILKLGESAGLRYQRWQWHKLTGQGKDPECE